MKTEAGSCATLAFTKNRHTGAGEKSGWLRIKLAGSNCLTVILGSLAKAIFHSPPTPSSCHRRDWVAAPTGQSTGWKVALLIRLPGAFRRLKKNMNYGLVLSR